MLQFGFKIPIHKDGLGWINCGPSWTPAKGSGKCNHPGDTGFGAVQSNGIAKKGLGKTRVGEKGGHTNYVRRTAMLHGIPRGTRAGTCAHNAETRQDPHGMPAAR